MDKIRIAPALLALALAAYADGEPTQPPAPAKDSLRDPLARLLDADGDAKLSAEEIKGAPAMLLSKDSDRNGALSPEEVKAGGLGGEEPRRGGMLARIDTDGDGKISREEAPERLREQFDALDKNGDGYLDQEELRAMRGPGRGGRGGRGGRPGEPGQPGQPGEPGQPATNGDRPEGAERQRRAPSLLALFDGDKDLALSASEIENSAKALLTLDKDGDGALSPAELGPPPRPLAGLDKNRDGKVSHDEANERLQRRFDELDKNKDGFLDEAELKALDSIPGPSDREPD